MRINTNISALQAQRSMSEHSKSVESSSGKLSSGTRVRNASDDAASLAIGQKNKASVRSQNQAVRNANDAVSEFQVAEGAMNEMGNMLVRLRELSMQAATATLEDSDRSLLNMEYMELRQEIERIARSTEFNGSKILRSGSSSNRDFQIGTQHDANSTLSIKENDLTLTEFNLKLVDSSIPTAEEAKINLAFIDEAINKLSGTRAKVGSLQNRLMSAVNNLDTSKVNEMDAMSKRMDADFALETSEKLRSEGKLAAATSVLAQSNLFSAQTLKLLK